MTKVDYNLIVESSLNEVYIFSAITLRFIDVNHGARKNLGYTLEELRELTPIDLKPEYTTDKFLAALEPLYDHKTQKLRFETDHQRKDGTTYPVEVNLQLDHTGDEDVFVAIILDITERRTLTNRSAELGRILEDSLNEVYIFNADTLHFIEVNRGARENLGYTQNELQELTPLNLKPDYTISSFNKLIEPLRNGTTSKITFETFHLRKDGTTYPVEVYLQYSTLENRSVFVAIILDITERKNSEKKLLDLTLRNQRAELIQNFIRDTSHDFRTPLAILNVKSHILAKNVDDTNLLTHIKGMEKQVKRIEALVDYLQEASVLESIEEIDYEKIEIFSLIQQLIDDHMHIYHQKDVSISTQTLNDEAYLYGNQQMIQTAIYHILKNACDFNEPQGYIGIKIEDTAYHVSITIEDTGIGISEEDLPLIFNYLYRADKARTQGGYGLGLSIARRAIELHNGTIHVESEVGIGSTFIIKLPTYREQERHISTAIHKV